jgi:FMN phosphatase YigB (HAD superfamily)
MPLSLEQYVAALDARQLPWPAPPAVKRPKARPHLRPLPEVRAVIWSLYGTLLAIEGGELLLEHPKRMMMELALDKTVQEFKMWGAMTRKPGHPAEYLAQLYSRALAELKMVPSPRERYPEISVDKVWEDVIRVLLQKDYQWEVGFFGSLNEFCRKVAYFFHASLQGTACYPGAAAALGYVAATGLHQGWLDNGQAFTPLQLQRGLQAQYSNPRLDDVFTPDLRLLSHEVRARKPSEKLFRKLLDRLKARGIAPDEALYVGSNLEQDLGPARRLGMRTALFAGDRNSVQATPEQLKNRASRPDVMLTELTQIREVVPGPDGKEDADAP